MTVRQLVSGQTVWMELQLLEDSKKLQPTARVVAEAQSCSGTKPVSRFVELLVVCLVDIENKDRKQQERDMMQVVMVDRLPRLAGMVPVRWLRNRFSEVRAVRLASDEGIVPRRLFTDPLFV